MGVQCLVGCCSNTARLGRRLERASETGESPGNHKKPRLPSAVQVCAHCSRNHLWTLFLFPCQDGGGGAAADRCRDRFRKAGSFGRIIPVEGKFPGPVRLIDSRGSMLVLRDDRPRWEGSATKSRCFDALHALHALHWQLSATMFAAPWVCRACARSLRRAGIFQASQFIRRASSGIAAVPQSRSRFRV